MLRSFFIYLSKAGWARKIVTGWSVAWRMASRFIAGETLDEAINVIKALNAKGINATLDHLGEHTTNPQEAEKATNDIIQALDAIQASGVRANVSIKLTQIGLDLSDENWRRVFEFAPDALYLAELAGTDAILSRAKGYVDSGEAVKALHLTDVVLGADPSNAGANEVRLGALRALRAGTNNYIERIWLDYGIRSCEDRLRPGQGE